MMSMVLRGEEGDKRDKTERKMEGGMESSSGPVAELRRSSPYPIITW